MIGHDKIRVWAKMGYAARGMVYVVIGYLAFATVMGWGEHKADSKSAILSLKTQPFGELLLVVLVVGLMGYVIWRLIQGIQDTDNHGTSIKGLTIRFGLLCSAVTHTFLTYWVVYLLVTNTQSQLDSQQSFFSSSVSLWIFSIVGLFFIGVGVAHIYKGATARFERYLQIPDDKAFWTVPICQFGLIARGVVWLIVGVTMLQSVIVAGQSETKNIDDALQWLNSTRYGLFLTGVAALGLFAFGLYGFLESAYRRIEPASA